MPVIYITCLGLLSRLCLFTCLYLSSFFQQQLISTIIRPIDRCRPYTCHGEREEAVMEGGEEPELTSGARVSTGH